MAHLTFLETPENSEATASIAATGTHEKGPFLVFDQTLFYPQGGGQPADTGIVMMGNHPLPIIDVRMVEGEALHFVDKSADFSLFSPGKPVTLQIDRKRRNLNTRYHTAAHLIGHLAEALLEGAQAVKSHSFPGEAYVECAKAPEISESFINSLKNALAEAIEKNLSVVATLTTPEALAEIYPGSPFSAPEGKPLRVVTIDKFRPIPCGGTHVSYLGEIGPITLQSVKNKNGRLKISYALE